MSKWRWWRGIVLPENPWTKLEALFILRGRERIKRDFPQRKTLMK
jgi:hypothetical protein